MGGPDYSESEKEYLEAAIALAAERVEYSQEWQLARRQVNSDQHATQIAIERTEDAITLAQARLRIAEERLRERRS